MRDEAHIGEIEPTAVTNKEIRDKSPVDEIGSIVVNDTKTVDKAHVDEIESIVVNNKKIRDEAPVDEVEDTVVNDNQIMQSNLIAELQLQIANITDQNKLLQKEKDDLRSDLRLEAAAYEARKVEVENTLETEKKKMKEEKSSLEERINDIVKEKKGLEENMIESRFSFQKEMEDQKSLTRRMKNELDIKIQILTEENHQLEEVVSKSNEQLINLQHQNRVIKKKSDIITEENNELKATINDLQRRYDEEKANSKSSKLESKKTISDLKDQVATHTGQIEELHKNLKNESSQHEKKHAKMKAKFELEIFELSTQNHVVLF